MASTPDTRVIATVRDLKKADALKALPGSVDIVELDVSSEQSINSLAGKLDLLNLDGIDYFVGNAGISGDIRPTIEFPYNDYLNTFKTNVLGNIFIFKLIYPLMLKKQSRKVIFISSIAGRITEFVGMPLAAYGLSKVSVNMLTKFLTLDHQAENFIFLPVHPGVVDTDMMHHPDISDEIRALANMITPEFSASSVLKLFETLTPEMSGKFFSYTGEELSY